MSFFAILLVGFILGDLLWARLAWGALPSRAARLTALGWIAAMLTGLLLILTSRFTATHWDDALPRPFLSAIFAWHLLILPAWLLWRLLHTLSRVSTRTLRLPTPTDLSRRQFLTTSTTFAPALLVGGSALLAEHQLETFRIRRLTLPLPDLPPALDGLTLAHLSDLHIGRFTRAPVLDRIVRTTNDLGADLILLTGDLINYSLRDLPAGIDLLRSLRARHGTYLCEGNHDLIEDPSAFHRHILRSGLPFLRGETHTLSIADASLQILGLPWTHGDSTHARAIAQLDAQRRPDAFPLLLAHHPHAFDFAPHFPLMLAGHTHGGQLMLNEQLGFGPAFFRYWSGPYHRQGRTLVVSNGVGNWFPVRIAAPAEILHLTLRRADPAMMPHVLPARAVDVP